jgi:hypothetical protein
MMRPSGVLTRFIVSLEYQVSEKHTTEKERLSESIQLPYEYSFGCENGTAAIAGGVSRGCRRSRSDVAPAPLQLLPDDAEE